MVPPKKHLLRHQPANAQIGLMEGNTFCTTLQPRLFTMDLNVVEHKVFYTEVGLTRSALKWEIWIHQCVYALWTSFLIWHSCWTCVKLKMLPWWSCPVIKVFLHWSRYALPLLVRADFSFIYTRNFISSVPKQVRLPLLFYAYTDDCPLWQNRNWSGTLEPGTLHWFEQFTEAATLCEAFYFYDIQSA